MTDQAHIDYDRIATAIHYLKENFKEQPSLEDIAQAVNLSPFHFQRLFTEWAGVSPKKFIQYLNIEYAKKLLRNQQSTLIDTAYKTGLSGSSRLHDLFINIEGMTPGEFKHGGEGLAINYSFSESPFGKIIIATTTKGICHMSFTDDENTALTNIKNKFPNANYHQTADQLQQDALYIFQMDWKNLKEIKLHLTGTPFQLKVWKTLLKIPLGKLNTYGTIAHTIGKPRASRAVGTAIGSNPVAFIIPCHRVIQTNGNTGEYMWGSIRKKAIIAWEAAKINS